MTSWNTHGEKGRSVDEDVANETPRGVTGEAGDTHRFEATNPTILTENCSQLATISVGDNDCSVINTQWSTTNVSQCIFRNDDGSYGWRWSRGSTGSDTPNYPEVLIGTKPWGADTGTDLFPIQRGDIDTLELSLAVDQTPSDGAWNLATEWWLTSAKPDGDVSDTITHEIMTVLDWSDEHANRHGSPIEANAFTDDYGNQYDYWAQYKEGEFNIFRITGHGQQVPANIDFSAVVEYVSGNIANTTDGLYVSGIELGNEYWDNTSGETILTKFDVTLNGQTARSGTSQRPAPPTLSGPGLGLVGESHSFAVESTDPDGADIHYRLRWGDGTETRYPNSGTVRSGTQATVSNVWNTPGTDTVRAQAINTDGIESPWATHGIEISDGTGVALSASGDEIAPGGAATISLSALNVTQIQIADLWADWGDPVNEHPAGGTVSDQIETDGIYELSWTTTQSEISASLTIAPPSDTYTDGEYALTVTATDGATSVTDTATITIQ